MIRIFRDQTNLSANPGLWNEIQKALDQSEFYIYLASPQAAKSRWVRAEFEYWYTHRDPDKALIVLADGSLEWDQEKSDFDWSKTNAIPEGMKRRYASMPFWVDLSWVQTEKQLSDEDPRYQDAVASLAATLHGKPKDEIFGDDIRAHRQAIRVSISAICALIFLLGAAIWFGIQSNQSLGREMIARKEAELKTRIATSRQIATMASSLLDTQFDVGMLLAAEAMRTYPSFESRDVLFRAVRAQPALLRLVHPTTASREVLFLKDGRLLAMSTGENNGSVLVWDSNGKRLTSDFVVDEGKPSCLAMSRDETLLAVGFTARYGQRLAGGVVVFDLNTGSRWAGNATDEPPGGVKPPLPPTKDVTSIAFSPDGKTLVAGVRNGGGFAFWDTATKERRIVRPDQPPPPGTEAPRGESQSVTSVVFTPDGSQLIAVQDSFFSGATMLLDPNSGRWVDSLKAAMSIRKLVVSQDGDRIAMADFDKIIIWSRSQQKQLMEFAINSEQRFDRKLNLNSLAFSPDGKLLAAGLGAEIMSDTFPSQFVIGGRGGVKVWDIEHQRPLNEQPFEVPGYGVEGVSFSLDSRTLAAASFAAPGAPGVVALWSVDAMQKRAAQVLFAEDSIECVAFQPRGTLLATGTSSGTSSGHVILWDRKTLERVSDPLVAEGHVLDVAFSPDGKLLAAGMSWGDGQAPQGRVVLWDVNQRQRLTKSPLDVPEGLVTHVAFAAKGMQLSAAFKRRKGNEDTAAGIIVWNQADWKRAHQQPLVVDAAQLTGLAINHDGSILAAGTMSGDQSNRQARIMLWNAAGQPLPGSPLDVTEGGIAGIAFSPDGMTLAATVFGQGKQGILLWDIATRARLTEEPLAVPEARTVYGPAFSEDGMILAGGFGSLEGPAEVVIWDVESRRRFSAMPMQVSRGMVTNVASMQDTLAALIHPSITVFNGRGHVALISINPDTWKTEASRIVNRNLTLAEWQNLFPNQPYRATFPELPVPAYSESFKSIARNLSGNEWRLYYADEPYRRTFPQLPDGPGVAEAMQQIKIE